MTLATIRLDQSPDSGVLAMSSARRMALVSTLRRYLLRSVSEGRRSRLKQHRSNVCFLKPGGLIVVVSDKLWISIIGLKSSNTDV